MPHIDTHPPATLPDFVGRWLRQQRQQRGWTQPILAKRTESTAAAMRAGGTMPQAAAIAQNQLSRIERGATVPNLLDFVVLARTLGTDPADALGRILQQTADHLPLFDRGAA